MTAAAGGGRSLRSAHIVMVTSGEIRPAGPVRRMFAVASDSAEAALLRMEERLRPNERATWLDARSLSLEPGEIRRL